ncbi:MAG: SDR family oxidoreductase [Alphaproteobacteria bacterium]
MRRAGGAANGGARRLLCFGLGYSARVLALRLLGEGWEVRGTARDPEAGEPAPGCTRVRFDRTHGLPPDAFDGVTHILVSVPPDAEGDPVLDMHGDDIVALTGLRWLGYLSTTGVYGDRGGLWVDETSELRPSGERGRRRVMAETGWLGLWRRNGVPVHVFRLAAIYGPGRGPFRALRDGTAKRILKPGQVFSRIHVEDLANVLAASIARPRPGAVYNVCDDEAAAPEAVVAYAAGLLGVEKPPLVPFAEAGLSAMARSFYDDNKLVSNARIKSELGVALRYPTYREGLAAILREEARGLP